MNSIQNTYQYAESNLSFVGWLGFLGFPVYYWIWVYLFPQPYESITMRAIGSLLCLGLSLRHWLPGKLQKFMPYYFYIAVGYVLPFFFSYMMIMNHYNTVWCMSFVASVCLHILLIHETKTLIIQAILAILAADLLAHVTQVGVNPTFIDWKYVPIFLFVYLFGNVFYIVNQVSYDSKVAMAKAFGGAIAHEMRNPLSAIRTSLELIQSMVNEKKSANNAFVTPTDLSELSERLNDMHTIIDSANDTINLLLSSVDQHRIPTDTFRIYSAREVVKHAVDSFSYNRQTDRSVVNIRAGDNFRFLGSEDLLKYAFYNLLKNAFRYQLNDDFHIEIRLKSYIKWNQITVRDNGIGISPSHLQDIFKDFYTHGKHGGSGLGLPFCRRIMEAFGGHIECDSEPGEWTEFTLYFPKENSHKIRRLKQELLQTKSLLYIGEKGVIASSLQTLAHDLEFHLDILTIQQAAELKAIKCDHVLLDIDTASQHIDMLMALERLLHFANIPLYYACTPSNQYPTLLQQRLRHHSLDKEQLTQMNRSEVISRIFFEETAYTAFSEREHPAITSHATTSGKQILIVDDTLSVRNLLTLLLQKHGYQVLQASNGREALTLMESETPDLILMDIDMPGIDGIETTAAIRQAHKPYSQIPILGHTGDSTLPTLDRIRQSGMNDFIVKPVNKDYLLNKLSNWI